MQIASHSAPGVTPKGPKDNQDSYLCDRELGLFLVCDGVSGNKGGKEASTLCVSTIQTQVKAVLNEINDCATHTGPEDRARIGDLLRTAVTRANQAVRDAGNSNPSLTGMTCTCEALLIRGTQAWVVHAGDSRTVLVRRDQARQLTEDHSVGAEMLRSGQWTETQAQKSPYAHVLTRAIGLQEYIHPDVLEFELASDDVLVLTSDGVNLAAITPQEAALFESFPERLAQLSRT
ncbi:MAG: protein phosphatase 2C domain-containing protein, partial [Bdellovibrionota bacterium]